MKQTLLAFLFVGLVAGHLSSEPHHHHHGHDHDGTSEPHHHHHGHDHDEDEHDHHHHGHDMVESSHGDYHGDSSHNLRPVCPFLAMLVPKLEGVQEHMDQVVRSANTTQKKPLDVMHVDAQQVRDSDTLVKMLKTAVQTSVVGVYPDLERNQAITVFDIYYEEGKELLRKRWAIELDEETGLWKLWQHGSLKEGVEGQPDIPYVHETLHALKEVGHTHHCKTLGSLLAYNAELEVVNVGEFDLSSHIHMGKRPGRHHSHSDDEDDEDDDRPMYEHLVGKAAIQQVCEKWAARQSRHITMQFVHPEEMFFREASEQSSAYDVLVTGSMEMKTVFADKVVHWPGAVRMTTSSKASTQSGVTSLKVYTLEATSLEMKWGWKYGSGGMAGFLKAMIGFGSVAAILLCLCCLCGFVATAACSTMWSQFFFSRCRSRRVVRGTIHGSGTTRGPAAPGAAQTAQPPSVRGDLAVPLRSAPLVPAPTTVTPQ